MDYQFVVEFSQFLAFQIGMLTLLMFTFFRTEIAFKRDINRDYQKILRDYRLTGVLSYYQLTQVFGDYSKLSLFKLITKRKEKGELERNLCSHFYKAFNLHETDSKVVELNIPILKNYSLKRLASLNLKLSDFKNPNKELKEMMLLKERILSDSISIENTIVIINECLEKTYLFNILKLLSPEKMSLLVFSFENIKSFEVQAKFIKIAMASLPYLSGYLVESMMESKSPAISLKGHQLFLKLKLMRKPNHEAKYSKLIPVTREKPRVNNI